MEKAANHYRISRILFIAAAVTPMISRLTRVQDGSSSRGLVLVGASTVGLVGLGFGFSGDINLKRGSGILRRIQLQQ